MTDTLTKSKLWLMPVAIVILLVIAALTFQDGQLPSERVRLSVLLVSCASVTLLAPLMTASFQRFDIFHPLHFVALSLFFGVFGRTFYILMSDSGKVAALLESEPIHFLIPGAVLSMVGSVLLSAGYWMAGGLYPKLKLYNALLENLHMKRLLFLAPLIFIGCALANYYFLKTTGFEYEGIDSISSKRRVVINEVESSLGYFRLIAQDVPRVMMFLLAAAVCSLRKPSWTLVLMTGAFGLLAVTLPFLSSSRGNVLLALIGLCVAIHKVRGLKLSTLAIAFSFSLVIIFGMLALRRVHSRNMSVADSISEMGLEPLFGNHSFADIVKLSSVYKGVPELIGYKYGSSFLTILYAPIPRSIWPDKPAVAMGREITEKLYNKGLDLKDKGGGTPPGIFAESIINFSVYGFPFAIFAMGLLLRFLHNILENLQLNSLAGVALYAGIIPSYCLNLLGGDFTRALTQSLSTVLIVSLLAAVTRVKSIV